MIPWEEIDRVEVPGHEGTVTLLKRGPEFSIGILAVWSSEVNEAFTRRLKQCGFQTETVTVRDRKPGKGARHTIWLAGKS